MLRERGLWRGSRSKIESHEPAQSDFTRTRAGASGRADTLMALNHPPRSGRNESGALLLEALVALAILGVILLFGLSFFARRRQLERERLDRETALRVLESEWVYLRTASGHLEAREKEPFIGSLPFLALIEKRSPALSVRKTEFDTLVFVHLDIGYGIRVHQRTSQEGYVLTAASPTP